jgi:hypothetical protein
VSCASASHQLVKMTPEREKKRGVRVTPDSTPTRKSVEDGAGEDLRR